MAQSLNVNGAGLIIVHYQRTAFSALTLLAGRQEEHPASKNRVVRYWHGYLSSEVQIICIWSS